VENWATIRVTEINQVSNPISSLSRNWGKRSAVLTIPNTAPAEETMDPFMVCCRIIPKANHFFRNMEDYKFIYKFNKIEMWITLAASNSSFLSRVWRNCAFPKAAG